MNPHTAKVEGSLDEAVIKQYCKQLRLPTLATQAVRIAEESIKRNQSHLRYLNVLLSLEVEERDAVAETCGSLVLAT